MRTYKARLDVSHFVKKLRVKQTSNPLFYLRVWWTARSPDRTARTHAQVLGRLLSNTSLLSHIGTIHRTLNRHKLRPSAYR